MRFTIASFILPALVAAQNAFNVPAGGYKPIEAGSSVDLKWTPTTGGTVTLVLRSGSAGNLSPGTIIEANVDNSGSYTWMVPSNLAKGDNYAIQIVDDQNTNVYNFTPMLSVDSNVDPSQASSVTGAVTLGSASGTPSATATDASSTPSGASSAPASSMATGSVTGMPTTMRSSTRTSAAVSTVAPSSTGAAFKALPTGVAGAVGAVMGAAAFIL